MNLNFSVGLIPSSAVIGNMFEASRVRCFPITCFKG